MRPVKKNALRSIDTVRKARGLMTLSELESLSESGNIVFDPFSVLISKDVVIGNDNIFYPGVCIIAGKTGKIKIGNKNEFHCNTYLESSEGCIAIGSSNQFGTGGFSAKSNREGSSINIGDFGRYLNGPLILGLSFLNSGSQILGQITVDNCILEAGDSFLGQTPDNRAGLLKGCGSARNLTVPKGHVITGYGVFRQEDMLPQAANHLRS